MPKSRKAPDTVHKDVKRNNNFQKNNANLAMLAKFVAQQQTPARLRAGN